MPINQAIKWLRTSVRVWPLGVAAILAICTSLALSHDQAYAAGSDFNIQVSPSPIVVNLVPGQTQTATLTIRNFSNHDETLTPGLRGVQARGSSTSVSLTDNPPGDMAHWVHFSSRSVTIAPAQTVPLTVTFNTPASAGFSYTAAISLTSTRTAKNTSGSSIRPQVDVFCLANIKRDDAKSALEVTRFTGDKHRYAFLPATFTATIKNTGNVISQPTGTIFIQRTFTDAQPIAAIPVNQAGGYILPGTSRTFTSSWNAGFPVYITTENGQRHLRWDWRRLGELRLGRYVAKAVIVYDNGHQDVPVVTAYSFWVIPWLLIVALILLVIVLVMGIIAWGRLLFVGTKKVKGYATHRKK